jgi:hypothetical protein
VVEREKRSWFRRLSDPLIGPDATAAELALGWGAAVASAVAQLAWALAFGHWSALQTIVAVIFAFDIGGGVLVNATRSGRRWWHRDEVTRARSTESRRTLGVTNKRIEQNASRSAVSRRVSCVCSCAVRWTD